MIALVHSATPRMTTPTAARASRRSEMLRRGPAAPGAAGAVGRRCRGCRPGGTRRRLSRWPKARSPRQKPISARARWSRMAWTSKPPMAPVAERRVGLDELDDADQSGAEAVGDERDAARRRANPRAEERPGMLPRPSVADRPVALRLSSRRRLLSDSRRSLVSHLDLQPPRARNGEDRPERPCGDEPEALVGKDGIRGRAGDPTRDDVERRHEQGGEWSRSGERLQPVRHERQRDQEAREEEPTTM